jgi:hypothetical protein
MAPKLYAPTKFGQSLIIEEGSDKAIQWLMIMMAVFGLKYHSFAAIIN